MIGSEATVFGVERSSAEFQVGRIWSMDRFAELDVVRVVILRHASREFTGTDAVTRQPQVGDVGTIVHEHDAVGSEDPVVVEMVDDHGATVWVADFERSELELVQRP